MCDVECSSFKAQGRKRLSPLFARGKRREGKGGKRNAFVNGSITQDPETDFYRLRTETFSVSQPARNRQKSSAAAP
jgi:hypothetical protein